MKILFSVSFNQTFEVPRGRWQSHWIDVEPVASDVGLRGARQRLFHVQRAWNVARQARGYEALALCSVSIEAVFVARFRRALCPKTRLVCADFLVPRFVRFDACIGRWLGAVHSFVTIRRGDAGTLQRRFGYPAERCHFAYFPVARDLPVARSDGDYLYAAGNAHRDWPTLLAALQRAPQRAILSPDGPLEVPPELAGLVEVRPQLPTEQGRELLARSRFVVMPFVETDLPSGPLVLLDAMGLGKAVAVTQVNGSRDYVRDGETALVVPPGDAPALAHALTRLNQDAALRQTLGAAAQTDSRARFTNENFIAEIVAQCAA